MKFVKKNWIALLLCSSYLIVIAIYVWVTTDHSKSIEINELGDFLSGVFAPLAFLFLILGYIQQGKELKQNTEALRLQAEELKNSVEEQRHLVKAANEDFNLSKKQYAEVNYKELIQAQPFFHFSDVTLSMGEYFDVAGLKLNFKINNSRTTCREVKINIKVTPENGGAIVNSLEIVKAGEDFLYSCSICLSSENNKFKNNILSEDIDIRYQDAFDNIQIQKFKFTLFKKTDTPKDLLIDNYFVNRKYESYKNNHKIS